MLAVYVLTRKILRSGLELSNQQIRAKKRDRLGSGRFFRTMMCLVYMQIIPVLTGLKGGRTPQMP